MRIIAPDDIAPDIVAPGDLPASWRASDSQTCRPIGDAWLAEHKSAVLLVRSAIIPFEQNVLINPPASRQHPDRRRRDHALSVGCAAAGRAFAPREWDLINNVIEMKPGR